MLALVAGFAATKAEAFSVRGAGSGFGRNAIKEFFLQGSGNQVFGSGQTKSGQSFSLNGVWRRNGAVSGTIQVDGQDVGTFEGSARPNGFLGRYRLRGRGASSGNLMGRPYSFQSQSF